MNHNKNPFWGDTNSPNSPKQVSADLRGHRVMELRAEGKSYRRIARQMQQEGDTSIDESGAYRALVRALKKYRTEMAEMADDVRSLELERLDLMLAAIWADAEAGNTKAIETVLRLMDRRARYLGLDKPGEWPEGASGQPEAPGLNVAVLGDEELEDLRAKLARMRGLEG